MNFNNFEHQGILKPFEKEFFEDILIKFYNLFDKWNNELKKKTLHTSKRSMKHDAKEELKIGHAILLSLEENNSYKSYDFILKKIISLREYYKTNSEVHFVYNMRMLLFSWGSNSSHQLGHSVSKNYVASPKPLRLHQELQYESTREDKGHPIFPFNVKFNYLNQISPEFKNFIKKSILGNTFHDSLLPFQNLSIRCSYSHNVVQSSEKIYTWGRGANGKLGLGDNHLSLYPCLIPNFREITPSKSSLELGEENSIILDTMPDNSSVIFGCGSIEHWTTNLNPKHLARENKDAKTNKTRDKFNSLKLPIVKILTNQPVSAIACGASHTLIIVNDCIFACGSNKFGQCGLGEEIEFVNEFTPLKLFKTSEIFANEDASLSLGYKEAHYWGGFKNSLNLKNAKTIRSHFFIPQILHIEGYHSKAYRMNVANNNRSHFAFNNDFGFALGKSGRIFYWKNDNRPIRLSLISDQDGFSSISISGSTLYALKDGRIYYCKLTPDFILEQSNNYSNTNPNSDQHNPYNKIQKLDCKLICMESLSQVSILESSKSHSVVGVAIKIPSFLNCSESPYYSIKQCVSLDEHLIKPQVTYPYEGNKNKNLQAQDHTFSQCNNLNHQAVSQKIPSLMTLCQERLAGFVEPFNFVDITSLGCNFKWSYLFNFCVLFFLLNLDLMLSSSIYHLLHKLPSIFFSGIDFFFQGKIPSSCFDPDHSKFFECFISKEPIQASSKNISSPCVQLISSTNKTDHISKTAQINSRKKKVPKIPKGSLSLHSYEVPEDVDPRNQNLNTQNSKMVNKSDTSSSLKLAYQNSHDDVFYKEAPTLLTFTSTTTMEKNKIPLNLIKKSSNDEMPTEDFSNQFSPARKPKHSNNKSVKLTSKRLVLNKKFEPLEEYYQSFENFKEEKCNGFSLSQFIKPKIPKSRSKNHTNFEIHKTWQKAEEISLPQSPQITVQSNGPIPFAANSPLESSKTSFSKILKEEENKLQSRVKFMSQGTAKQRNKESQFYNEKLHDLSRNSWGFRAVNKTDFDQIPRFSSILQEDQEQEELEKAIMMINYMESFKEPHK